MKTKKLKQIEDKFRKVYYEYFTDYLLFSAQYESLIEKGSLDEFIHYGYMEYLYETCKELEDNNIYPNNIILNFIHLVSLLEQRIEQIMDENTQSIYQTKTQEMLQYLYNEIDTDEKEIYYMEYIKRYSNMENISSLKGISVSHLELDLQKDFLYLDILNWDGVKKIDLIGDDFSCFLQKLLIDFPEISDCPSLMKNLEDIIYTKNDKELDKYLYLLKHFKEKEYDVGFNINTMELLYCKTLLQKMIFNGNVKETLKELDPNILFTISFFQSLCDEFTVYTEKREISLQEKETFKEIVYFMRDHLKECSGVYKDAFNLLLNSWIIFFNSNPTIVEPTVIYANSLSKSDDLHYRTIPSFLLKEKEFYAKANIQMELAYDIMSYFFGKDNLEELKEEGMYTVSALHYLFYEYPKMFFDATVYQKTMLLLNSIQNKKGKKLKEKIKKIREE